MTSRLKRFAQTALERAGISALKSRDAPTSLGGRHESGSLASAGLIAENEALREENRRLQETTSQLRVKLVGLQNHSEHDLSERDYQWLMAQRNLRMTLENLDPGFVPLYERCRAHTMTSVERMFALYNTIQYVVRENIPGDIAECGVWRGGSMMLAAETLMALGATDRTLLLYDTFEGHPKPDAEKDVDIWGVTASKDWKKYARLDGTSDWARVSLEETRKNIESTGYPAHNVSFIKGMVENTLPAHAPESLAVLRLDVDWYAATRVALEILYPKLSPGGVLIIDDYGHYKGCRQAVDEFFNRKNGPVLLVRIDYSCRLAVKPGAPGR